MYRHPDPESGLEIVARRDESVDGGWRVEVEPNERYDRRAVAPAPDAAGPWVISAQAHALASPHGEPGGRRGADGVLACVTRARTAETGDMPMAKCVATPASEPQRPRNREERAAVIPELTWNQLALVAIGLIASVIVLAIVASS